MSAGSPESAAQRNGPLPSAEQRPDVRGHEAGEVERALVPAELGLAADRVAVVEDLGAGVEEADHRRHVPGHRRPGPVGELVRLRGGVVGRVGQLHAHRQVRQRVVRAGLVGDDVDLDAPAQQLGEDHGRVADHADRQRPALPLRGQHRRDRLVQRVGDHVEVAVPDPAVQPVGVDVDDQAGAAVHGDRERLGAAHAAAAGGQRQRAGEGAAEPLGGDRGERLVGALQDALGADVDPRAGGHLAVHGQTELFQAAELGPGGPVADQVGVGQQHPGRPLVGAQHADRPAGLHQHRLVVAQFGQGPDQRVVRRPVAGGPPGAAVHDQVLRALGHLRVEVVHQHPHGRLLRPTRRRYGCCRAGRERAGTSGSSATVGVTTNGGSNGLTVEQRLR